MRRALIHKRPLIRRIANQQSIGIDQIERRIVGDHLHLRRQVIRIPTVIAVKKGDDSPRACRMALLRAAAARLFSCLM